MLTSDDIEHFTGLQTLGEEVTTSAISTSRKVVEIATEAGCDAVSTVVQASINNFKIQLERFYEAQRQVLLMLYKVDSTAAGQLLEEAAEQLDVVHSQILQLRKVA